MPGFWIHLPIPAYPQGPSRSWLQQDRPLVQLGDPFRGAGGIDRFADLGDQGALAGLIRRLWSRGGILRRLADADIDRRLVPVLYAAQEKERGISRVTDFHGIVVWFVFFMADLKVQEAYPGM